MEKSRNQIIYNILSYIQQEGKTALFWSPLRQNEKENVRETVDDRGSKNMDRRDGAMSSSKAAVSLQQVPSSTAELYSLLPYVTNTHAHTHTHTHMYIWLRFLLESCNIFLKINTVKYIYICI